MSITDFKEIREDGRVIPESMTREELASQEWPISRIREVRWRDAGKEVQLTNSGGILARILPNRSGVIALFFPEVGGNADRALIYDADGRLRHDLAKPSIDGVRLSGGFAWLESSEAVPTENVGIVFSRDSRNELIYFDVDPRTGGYVGYHRTR